MIERDGSLTSLWQTTTKADYSGNSMLTDQQFEVVIVGGGITGLTTALALQEIGFKCIVLEANTLCFGTTGGTTAHLNTVLDTPYTTLIKNFGEKNASLVARIAEDAIEHIRKNVGKYGIDAEFKDQDAYMFSQNPDQTKELEEIREASATLGIGIEYTDHVPFSIKREKTVVIHRQASFHPTRYVLGLAKAFTEMGGRIVERCRVTDAENQDPILVHTDQGQLSCSYLIYATHIPPGVNVLDTRCAPYRTYAMAVRLKGEYPDGLIYDMYDPYHYYRSQEIDGDMYLIAGGEDHKTGHEENAEGCFRRLEAYLRGHFDIDEISYKWSSQYFEPNDGLPYIGHLPGSPGNILVATGFGGNGMIYATVSALIFRSMLLREESEYIALFDPNRIKPVAGFTNFVRENADVAKKWLGKWLGEDKLESFAAIAPGEGQVVKVEGHTIAIYKSENGDLMALSPDCTHMGCHVTWNNAEKSWDCPCHGARYNIDGTVLTGPADRDLEKISLRKLVG